jgi:transcriptional regulator GlxA family with amidase domain
MMASPLRVVFFAYPGVQALDVSGPLEIFARATRLLRDEGRPHPGYSLCVAALEPGPVTASSGFRFLPDRTLSELGGPIDTLLVIGGVGIDRVLGEQKVLAWLRQTAPRVRRLGSVCTGAFLLAEAGLLDGRRVATHWSRAEELAARYPQIRVEPDPIFVRDGNIITSAGVSAGMDLALALIEEDLGPQVALGVARAMVLYLRRPGDQSQFSAPLRLQTAALPTLRDLVTWAVSHPTADLSIPALAHRAAMSPRHLSRLFRREIGVSPARAVEALRIEAAQRALAETRAGIEEIAARSGFGSAEVLRRSFLRVLHATPSEWRARFGPQAPPAIGLSA